MMQAELNSLEATNIFGQKLAKLLGAGSIVALKGGLGVGKTALCHSILRMICNDIDEAQSPTFPIALTYETKMGITLWHIDCYRLTQINEFEQLGFLDDAPHAIALIEWPEIIESVLPTKNRIDITLAYGKQETSRIAYLTGDHNVLQLLNENAR
jgi:tRNA threonylcarbamoyladenosine biosynthesis protein TsaE